MRSLYEDKSLWGSRSAEFSVAEWINASYLFESAKSCRDKLESMSQASFVLGEVHGAAFLGASCVRAFRLAASATEIDSKVDECWDICCGIVSLLGKVRRLMHLLC